MGWGSRLRQTGRREELERLGKDKTLGQSFLGDTANGAKPAGAASQSLETLAGLQKQRVPLRGTAKDSTAEKTHSGGNRVSGCRGDEIHGQRGRPWNEREDKACSQNLLGKKPRGLVRGWSQGPGAKREPWPFRR